MKEFYTLEIYKDSHLVHTQEAHYSVINRLLFQWYYPGSPYVVKVSDTVGKTMDINQVPSLLAESNKL